MTQYEDDGDRWADEDEPDDRAVCNRCGAAGLHWQQAFSADGRGEYPALFTEGNRKHVCPPPSADDFGVVT